MPALAQKWLPPQSFPHGFLPSAAGCSGSAGGWSFPSAALAGPLKPSTACKEANFTLQWTSFLWPDADCGAKAGAGVAGGVSGQDRGQVLSSLRDVPALSILPSLPAASLATTAVMTRRGGPTRLQNLDDATNQTKPSGLGFAATFQEVEFFECLHFGIWELLPPKQIERRKWPILPSFMSSSWFQHAARCPLKRLGQLAILPMLGTPPSSCTHCVPGALGRPRP